MSIRLSSIFFNFLPIKKKRVCFINFDGQGFGDNPKYIALELLKHEGFELIWLYNPKKKVDFSMFPKGIRLVKKESLLGLYCLSTCNVLISNSRTSFFSKGFKKKKQQIYIQTWHGGFSFKKIEADYTKLPSKYIENAKKDSENIDYLSSGSKWSEEALFKESFWYSGKYFRGGNPRNDILFKKTENIKNKINRFYNFSPLEKIVMYAPTFRDNHSQNVYQIDYLKLKNALEVSFKNKFVVLSRLHPNMIMEKNTIPEYDWLIDASKYPDMQELLSVTDVLITDYSSSIFDFMLTKRPGFILATDKEYYEKERGFKIRFEDTPFPIAYNNEQLIDNILQFDVQEYTNNILMFSEKMGMYDDGNASQKLVDLIIEKGNDVK